jgi:hypothetical protein
MSSFKKPPSFAAGTPGTTPSAKLPDQNRPQRIAITVDHRETRLPVTQAAPTIH